MPDAVPLRTAQRVNDLNAEDFAMIKRIDFHRDVRVVLGAQMRYLLIE